MCGRWLNRFSVLIKQTLSLQNDLRSRPVQVDMKLALCLGILTENAGQDSLNSDSLLFWFSLHKVES